MLELSQGPKMMKTLLPGNLLDAFEKREIRNFYAPRLQPLFMLLRVLPTPN